MKVLHVIPSCARRDGGPAEVMRQLIPALRAVGVEADALTTDKRTTPDELVELRRAGHLVEHALPPRRWTFSPGLARRVWRLAPAYDVLHVHSVFSFPTTVALWAARAHGRPVVLEPHGGWENRNRAKSGLVKRLYWLLFDSRHQSAVSHVVFSSPRELADSANGFHGALPAEVPLGVDPTLFDIAPDSPRSRDILFLGRVSAVKRVDLLLRALAEEPLSGARLIIAGPIESGLGFRPQELAEALGVASRVEFVGPVDAQARRQLLATCGVFVLTSEDESFGIAVAEALAAAAPVVCSSHVGIAPSVALAGGLRTCSMDPAEIAQTVADVLEGDSDKMRLAGRAYAREEFAWQRTAERLRKVYTEAIGEL